MLPEESTLLLNLSFIFSLSAFGLDFPTSEAQAVVDPFSVLVTKRQMRDANKCDVNMTTKSHNLPVFGFRRQPIFDYFGSLIFKHLTAPPNRPQPPLPRSLFVDV